MKTIFSKRNEISNILDICASIFSEKQSAQIAPDFALVIRELCREIAECDLEKLRFRSKGEYDDNSS